MARLLLQRVSVAPKTTLRAKIYLLSFDVLISTMIALECLSKRMTRLNLIAQASVEKLLKTWIQLIRLLLLCLTSSKYKDLALLKDLIR